MRAIDKAKAHFNSLETKRIEVPEWGDENEPLVIFVKPLTLSETSKLFQLSKSDEIEMLAQAIILKSLDEDGNKHFNIGDKLFLMNNADRDVVVRVAGEIMGTLDVSQAKKVESDQFLYAKHSLAEVLHKTIGELEEMPMDEFLCWIAYFEIKNEKLKNGKEKVSFLITAKDQASKVFRGLNSTMKVVNKTVGGITKALGKFTLVTGATATAVTLLSKRIMDQVDSIDKVSKKIGVTAEFLQKLRFASDIAGVEIRTTDMALQRFTRRMAEARDGTGESKKALQELGVAFFDSQGNARATEEVFIDVTKALANTENRADQLRLAFKLFDSEGVGLINVVNDLVDQFDKFEAMGLGVSTANVQKVAGLKDTFVEINAIIQTLQMSTFAGLSDEIQTLATTIREKLIDEIGGDAEKFGEELGEKIKAIVLAMTVGIQAMLNAIVKAINVMANLIQNASDKLNLGIQIFPENAEVEKQRKFLENQLNILTSTSMAQRSKRKKSGVLQALGLDVDASEEEINTAIATIEQKLTDLGERALLNTFDFAKTVEDFLFSSVGVTPKDDTTTGDDQGTEKQEPKLTKIQEKIQQYGKDLKAIGQVDIADSMIAGIKSVEDSFVDLFQGSTQGFKDLAQSIKTNFIRFLVKEFITSGLTKLLGSFGINTSGDSFGGRMLGSLFGRANGGTILAGQTALVGERGAEVITANQDLMVKPANQTRDLLANTGGANVNFNITASDVNGFDELLVKRKNLLISLINEGMNKNGKAGLV